MDEVSVLYLIVILYLIKEIIRISNKKRYPPLVPTSTVIFN